ncbi:MAG TPA: hypothetical protein DCR77_13200 [Flavobacteriaceae bacterium]|nr:hypothetical protein [Flavobacteriaceae bacterium]
MKKNCLVMIAGLISCFSHAQIGVNTIPHESTIFDMSESKKGFLLSKIALKTPQAGEPIKDTKAGVLVYNSTKNNSLYETYYIWNNNNWEPIFNEQRAVIEYTSTGIHASALGYNPSGEGNTAPEEFKFENVTAKKVKACEKFTDSFKGAIEHTYCAYKLTDNIDWEQAFNMAKSLKGYLAVITTNNEWTLIKEKFIDQPEASSSNVWIGYNQITEPGNKPEFTWISGEKSRIEWSNTSNLQSNFSGNLDEKCVYISNDSNKTWSSELCNAKTNYDYIIVEFQK